MQEDIIKDTQHHITKECRQQLKAQLYQQRENIQFDPILQAQCTNDIKQYCYDLEPGNSQVVIYTYLSLYLYFDIYINANIITSDSRMFSGTQVKINRCVS